MAKSRLAKQNPVNDEYVDSGTVEFREPTLLFDKKDFCVKIA